MNKLTMRTLIARRRQAALELERLQNSEAKLRKANSILRDQLRDLTATLKRLKTSSRTKRP